LLVTTIATGTLYVLSFVALHHGHPGVETSGQEIVAWFSENGAQARTYAWLSALVAMGFTILGGLLASVMPRPHRYIFLGGAVGFAVTAQVQAWFWAGLAFHPQNLNPGTARVLLDITQFWAPVVNSSMVAMAAPVAALGLGADPVVPRWLAWLSAIFGIEQAIETINRVRPVRLHHARRHHECLSRRLSRVSLYGGSPGLGDAAPGPRCRRYLSRGENNNLT
jgi:hypothetical protein